MSYTDTVAFYNQEIASNEYCHWKETPRDWNTGENGLTVSTILDVFLSFLSPFLVSAFVSEVVPLRNLCATDQSENYF